MKRTTEINIELTRTLLIHPRHAAPCACAARGARGEMVTPDEAVVMADAGTCVISRRIEADRAPFVENDDAGEVIEVESAEGQLILAAAVRSLEQRLSAQDRASWSVPPEPTSARRSRMSRRFYAKLRWLRHIIIHPTSAHRPRKES